MDFDYQKIKDAEFQQREERLGDFAIHHPVPKPRPSVATENHLTPKKPPVKPRRSIKGRPTTQQEADQLNQGQQKENETAVKRIDPALVLGPPRPLEALSPCLRANTLLWFERTQLPRLQTPGQPLPCWLHGFATRREAEQLLQDKPLGCFLLRLSESKIGFVLSYRGEDRCRHFIIEEEESGAFGSVYLIAGESSHHKSLENLISYYTQNPVGPFNELLTVPCTQPYVGIEEIERLRNKETEVNGKATDQEEKTKLPLAIGPAVLNQLPTNPPNQITSATGETVQYAAIRKPLKKTLSLPECKCVAETAPPVLENGTAEPAERPSNPNLTGDQAHTVDAPYARVKKLPKAVSENTSNISTDPDLQGATAAFTPPSIPNFDSTADPKYWQLEPLHTYEETPFTHSRPEDIDCYAVGWRRQANEDAVNLLKNHEYSEVNIKGAQEGNAVPRPGPSLPLRPPPRSTHGPLRPEITAQSFGVSPMMAQPQYSGFHHSDQPRLDASSNSIYEQIPERSRPPLQPLNPRR
ncbi:uncharacterized protein si:ch73-109i22.2 [Danio rerio]|uniref:Si:ch73-109i22.2 n=1 Tax=Danio rerio TaxID=7955 RepID=E7FFT4_DANRE|nr:uncharacterized protein si:ch73-109i22.2 [Danio rerio]|eukprot:XP_698916.2 uncharacterized protein si:ch73-109i22.2 [Danio rerio]